MNPELVYILISTLSALFPLVLVLRPGLSTVGGRHVAAEQLGDKLFGFVVLRFVVRHALSSGPTIQDKSTKSYPSGPFSNFRKALRGTETFHFWHVELRDHCCHKDQASATRKKKAEGTMRRRKMEIYGVRWGANLPDSCGRNI
jgi:hypothetical protein